jgi:hypothetical protein
LDSTLFVGIIAAITGIIVAIIKVLEKRWQKKNTEREERQKEVQKTLEELGKIEVALKGNRAVFDDLVRNRDNALDLMENTGFLTFYRELPSGDRKEYWKDAVKRMRDNNKTIVGQLDKLGRNPELRDTFIGCGDFRNHADEWERMWKIATESEPKQESDPFIQEHQKSRRRFPSKFESSLKDEIANLEKRLKQS